MLFGAEDGVGRGTSGKEEVVGSEEILIGVGSAERG